MSPAAGGLIMVFGGVDPENAPFPAEAVADSFGAGGFFSIQHKHVLHFRGPVKISLDLCCLSWGFSSMLKKLPRQIVCN